MIMTIETLVTDFPQTAVTFERTVKRVGGRALDRVAFIYDQEVTAAAPSGVKPGKQSSKRYGTLRSNIRARKVRSRYAQFLPRHILGWGRAFWGGFVTAGIAGTRSVTPNPFYQAAQAPVNASFDAAMKNVGPEALTAFSKAASRKIKKRITVTT